MYSLMETNQDIEQFLKSIYRYIQIGIYIRGYHDKKTGGFRREIGEVTEFHVTKDNRAEYNVIYRRTTDGDVIRSNPSPYLIDYLEVQGVKLTDDLIHSADVYGEGSKIPVDTEQELKKLEEQDKMAKTETKPVAPTTAVVENNIAKPEVSVTPQQTATAPVAPASPATPTPQVAPTNTTEVKPAVEILDL